MKEELPVFLDVKQFAAASGLPEGYIDKISHIDEGFLPSTLIGRKKFIAASELVSLEERIKKFTGEHSGETLV